MKRKFILPLLLLVQIVLVKILSFFPEFVERFYSNGLYVGISKFSRITFGSIPFSVGDCIYFIVIFFVLRWLWQRRKSWTRGGAERSGAKSEWKSNLLRITSFLSVFYFLFNMLWALNYHRVRLFEKMEIQKEYSDADLLAFTKKLIAKTNAIHHQIEKNDRFKVIFPYTQEQVFEMNLQGYQSLSSEYPFLKYENPSVKKSLISLPLTYMGFSGYLNPFTNEAHVNDLGPMYNFPMTTSHEMAHQLGYASESEANFIGFLASIKNENVYFQYAGYSVALRYCLRNWKIRDEKVLKELLQTIHPGILANYQESEDFWDQYETFIETGFKVFYDNFLKFNEQKDGLESYSKFVNLMVNYYQDREI